MYSVTIETSFAASHGLRNCAGGDEPIHEHRWRLWVTASGPDLDEAGCLVDFEDLRHRIAKAVLPFEGRNINDEAPFKGTRRSPSAEAVAKLLFARIAEGLSGPVEKLRVEVEEAEGCRASYEDLL